MLRVKTRAFWCGFLLFIARPPSQCGNQTDRPATPLEECGAPPGHARQATGPPASPLKDRGAPRATVRPGFRPGVITLVKAPA
ncbi:MAG: hypothetical protein AB1426_05160 [Bacillota bacterium]